MSAPYKLDVTAEMRLEYQSALHTYLRGERPVIIVSEMREDLNGEVLDAHAAEMHSEFENSQGAEGFLARMKVTLAQAAQRDARYCAANRKFLLAHAMNSKLREDFEVYVAGVHTQGGLA